MREWGPFSGIEHKLLVAIAFIFDGGNEMSKTKDKFLQGARNDDGCVAGVIGSRIAERCCSEEGRVSLDPSGDERA